MFTVFVEVMYDTVYHTLKWMKRFLITCTNLTALYILYICLSVVLCLQYHLPALSLHAAPLTPLNLTFTPGGVLNDSVTLTWLPPEHPNGVVLFYQLLQSSSRGDIFVNTTDNTTTTVLSNLTPGTQYNFSVRAFTVAFGPFSAPLILHTADGEDTCSTICDRRECPPVPWRLNRRSQCHCFAISPLSLFQCPQCHKVSVPSAMVPPLFW